MSGTLLAFDLGAESGRGILGRFDGNRLTLEQVHRFENGGVALLDRLYWDPLKLFGEIESGLGMAGKMEPQLASVGIDTWGVDFVLLAADGTLLDNPRHYRDARTDGMLETAFQIMPREQIFSHTGIQFMKLNSLYQLLALRLADAPQLAAAQQLLMNIIRAVVFQNQTKRSRPLHIEVDTKSQNLLLCPGHLVFIKRSES